MRFTLKETEMELGHTSIENVFIDEFLPGADGRFVKVYLLAYKYAKNKIDNSKFTHSYIAKRLSLPLSDVLEAWEYWEKLSVVERVYYEGVPEDPGNVHFDVIFNNLTELYINSVHTAKVQTQKMQEDSSDYRRITADQLVFASQNPVLSKMFKDIENCIKRALAPNEKINILETLENLSMDPEVATYAFQESAEKKGKCGPNYVMGILRNWFDDGIRTSEDLMNHLKNNSDRRYIYAKIKYALGSPNGFASLAEKNTIDKWLDIYNFDLDMILKACEKTDATLNPSVRYLDSIITKWYQNDVNSLDSAVSYQEKSDKEFEESKNRKPQPSQGKRSYGPGKRTDKVVTKLHNFEQASSKYSEEELFDIWMKNRIRKK